MKKLFFVAILEEKAQRGEVQELLVLWKILFDSSQHAACRIEPVEARYLGKQGQERYQIHQAQQAYEDPNNDGMGVLRLQCCYE